MAKKLSTLKAKKIIVLNLKGYKQPAIAKMLHIDQTTVSKYLLDFKALANQKGIDAATSKYKVQDEMEEMNAVVSEFMASDLTLADVDVALQMNEVLQDSAIKHEDYKSFIKVCKKTADADYINVAWKLDELENKTGMNYKEILENAEKTSVELKESQKGLDSNIQKINTTKSELTELTEQKKKASDGLKNHMQAIGVTEKRLEKIEPLTLALNSAGIPDKDLPEYVKRQELLSEAGIGIDLFALLLEKIKVECKEDGGKKLLDSLEEYGSLIGVIKELHDKKQALLKDISGLEQKVEMKDKLTGEIKVLKANKGKLEVELSQLNGKKFELVSVKNVLYFTDLANKELTEKNNKLEQEILGKQAKRDSL